MKKPPYSLSFITFLAVILTSCNFTAEKTTPENRTLLYPEEAFIGTFVSEGYEEKAKGADWVSVTITQIRQNLFHVEVRSRSDIKKPTCTLTTDAHLDKKGELITKQSGLELGFHISGDILNIYSPSDKDLNYFCSGGATLAGKYKRLSGNPDQKQLDDSQFWKFLEYNDLTFSIQAIRDTLTIQPILPKGRADEVKIPFKGSIADAEIGDLDADGFPEVYVYIREGRDQHIRLEAYYLDKGISLRKIKSHDDPPLQPEEEKDYYGKDEYKLNAPESVLQRLFPIRGTNNFHFVEYVLQTENGITELNLRSVSTTNVVTSL